MYTLEYTYYEFCFRILKQHKYLLYKGGFGSTLSANYKYTVLTTVTILSHTTRPPKGRRRKSGRRKRGRRRRRKEQRRTEVTGCVCPTKPKRHFSNASKL